MAKGRELKGRIKSVENTRKITRTMEMVATARSKRALDRAKGTAPYFQTLSEIIRSMAQAGTIAHPFLKRAENVKRTLLLVITANRGLCGGYNTNVLHMTERWLAAEKAAGREVEIYLVGKKGINRFRFLKITAIKTYTHIDDKVTFQDAAAFAEEFMRRYLAGEAERVVVISTRYLTASTQKAQETELLPVEPEKLEKQAGAETADYIFEPDRETILKTLVPHAVTGLLYRLFLEATVSEQIARRIAMKLATDNAEEMIKLYTRMYNRQRQAGITQQITEVVTGAQALE
jgi:F-type H+-transporting ATPase subunit gamma